MHRHDTSRTQDNKLGGRYAIMTLPGGLRQPAEGPAEESAMNLHGYRVVGAMRGHGTSRTQQIKPGGRRASMTLPGGRGQLAEGPAEHAN